VKVTPNGSYEIVIPVKGGVVHDATVILELRGLRHKPE